MATLAFLLWGNLAEAQDTGGWWGGSNWWDWSDHRATIGARYFMTRLTSGSIDVAGTSTDLRGSQYGFSEDPEPFKELWGTWYIDRLGLRFNAEEDQRFFGNDDVPAGTERFSELDARGTRMGLDLDVVRYPFLRLGLNFDYHTSPVKFYQRDISAIGVATVHFYQDESNPMTIGVHGRLIPVHIREIPLTIQARGRMPVPFVKRTYEAKITDWEVSVGLRPSVWDMSLYGHSTFSMGIEVGFRSVSLELDGKGSVWTSNPNVSGPAPGAEIKARWQGAFVQVGLFY